LREIAADLPKVCSLWRLPQAQLRLGAFSSSDLQEFEHLLPDLLDGSRHHGRLSESAAGATDCWPARRWFSAAYSAPLGAGAYVGRGRGLHDFRQHRIHLRLYHFWSGCGRGKVADICRFGARHMVKLHVNGRRRSI
jgi:hypothetical protein